MSSSKSFISTMLCVFPPSAPTSVVVPRRGVPLVGLVPPILNVLPSQKGPPDLETLVPGLPVVLPHNSLSLLLDFVPP